MLFLSRFPSLGQQYGGVIKQHGARPLLSQLKDWPLFSFLGQSHDRSWHGILFTGWQNLWQVAHTTVYEPDRGCYKARGGAQQ